MRYYELTYLISPDLTEKDAQVFSEEINSFLQEKGGILDENKKIIKRNLGYPIQKQKTAFLKTLTFYFNPTQLPALEKKLKGEKNILRFLLIRRSFPEKAEKPKAKFPPLKEKPKKVEIKDIEKKLEEILKE